MFTILVILIVLSVIGLLITANVILNAMEAEQGLSGLVCFVTLLGWIIFGVYCYAHMPK